MAQKLRPQQAQVVDRQVTIQSSLQQVQELLEAGIGCVAYLRGLLPEDSFEDYKLLAPRPPVSRSSSKRDRSEDPAKENTPSSVRVKKLKRGASSEADKLLDYLEVGATEAIEKGYLHQLVFAIYLDPEEPTNLVESYTFTFSYETDPQGNKKPELVVQDQLSGMVISSSIFGHSSRDNTRKESDVKRQVQQMIKNLITSTQVLDELPRRRFLNVRLFYTDDTPPEYEPPHFRPVAIDAPGYSFSTPTVADEPDFGTLGTVTTGFHGVALHSVSIAHVLDTSYDENISLDEALARNKRDAASRPVVWNAESLAERVTDEDDKLVVAEPVAVKDPSGKVIPFELVSSAESEEMAQLRQKVGIEVNEDALVVAKGHMEETLVDSNISDNEALRRAIAATDKRPPSTSSPATQIAPVVSRQRSCRPPVPFFGESTEQYKQRVSASQAAEPQVPQASQPKGVERKDKQDNMPVETQLFDYSQTLPEAQIVEEESEEEAEPDTIQTQETQTSPNKAAKIVDIKAKRSPTKSSRSRSKFAGDACECGDKSDDGGMICCSNCEVWKHAACYGFETVKDSRIPDVFICYHCRAQAGIAESILDPDKEAEIEQAIADLQSLALFRRALAIVYRKGLLGMKELAERLDVDNATAGQVLKRLKAEEFVLEQTGTRRQRGKNSTQPESMRAPALCVNKHPKQVKRKKLEYFNPGQGAELAFTAALESSDADADADGQQDDAAMARPAQPGLRTDSLTLVSQDRRFDDAHNAQPSASGSRQAAVLVEATPSPAPSRAQTMDASQADSIVDNASQPANGIVRRESTEIFSTPANSSSPSAALAKTAAAPRLPVFEAPKSSYVPRFDKKGKGKAPAKLANDPFHRASSYRQDPDLMDINEADSEALPSKRRSLGEIDSNADESSSARTRSSKRAKKCSEASEIEV
ncbi:Meiosis-specific protein HOP1 [Rhodotorula toruloides]|uniref:BY PROTMAP: gi/472587831/gb/EMS25327.1/ meiosis-specific protein HOP1 [Rhodosporidium toruloides NP11] gi/647398892/emb/CDR43166.1/ RHTO0S07e09032g1_1 [Rhodosporidium toruloides] n=2 Tax=Rhodotorula toruloides TaxID=5286 RepID=A0A0K3CEB2_RHOTO|nr:Meiosis-specific protein HOP1 [Rhodotorula toruloides]